MTSGVQRLRHSLQTESGIAMITVMGVSVILFMLVTTTIIVSN